MVNHIISLNSKEHIGKVEIKMNLLFALAMIEMKYNLTQRRIDRKREVVDEKATELIR